jgi:hypothetical protein
MSEILDISLQIQVLCSNHSSNHDGQTTDSAKLLYPPLTIDP